MIQTEAIPDAPLTPISAAGSGLALVQKKLKERRALKLFSEKERLQDSKYGLTVIRNGLNQ